MEIVNISYKGSGESYQSYNNQDSRLVSSNTINASFGDSFDYIEYHVYDEIGSLQLSEYNATSYYPEYISNTSQSLYSSLNLDPQKDLASKGFNRGKATIQYNFLKNILDSNQAKTYWIKEVSTSRTEIKLSSQYISDLSIENAFNQYDFLRSNRNYFSEFYLNFGQNRLVISTNIAYAEDTNGSYLLIKLYEPLPLEFDQKSELWIVEKVAESVAFDVNVEVESEALQTGDYLRGPNFKVDVSKAVGQTTPYYNYNQLFGSSFSSSMQQLSSYYQDTAASINVDFTDFSNFVHFSSAEERINNFTYKLSLIESYNRQIAEQRTFSSIGGSTKSYVSSAISVLQSNIDNVTKNFDLYEYYLYYASESFSWPKRNTAKPYTLYSVTSSQALNWLGSTSTVPNSVTQSLLYSASMYDLTNKDLLSNSVPQYLLDDPSNTPYVTFVHMIGQHFDNIWLYYKDVTNRYNATNDPDTGISMDLVADALRSLGTKIYTDTNVSNNLYYSLFGYNPDGSMLPPTGSEKITTYVTSSLQTQSANDLQKEIYKRIYHNLPYLLKSKGTERGLKALIACYGIPDSILTVKEYGGDSRLTTDGIFDYDNNQKAYMVSSSSEISSSLLSPYASIQYYKSDNRVNNNIIEVAFSPSDKINQEISSSLGYFSMDQLIGDPTYQTSGSYPALDSTRKSYFSSSVYPYKVSEYIRLIKYFNNSLFKMVKDYVPARANVSTGIVVKSHVLERNKYARNEPSMSLDNNVSQSIDMITISAGDGGAMSASVSTQYSKMITGSVGLVPYTSSNGSEKYTGEFGGSEIVATSMTSVSNQTEVSDGPSGSIYLTINYGALYQNVSASIRSTSLFNLDYGYNQSVPVNFGLITQSIQRAQSNNYATQQDQNVPYAQVQDYNYNSTGYLRSRYNGSDTISSTYTTYTIGDSSYGNTAAIDKNKINFAYLVDIYSSSLFLPGRSNAQIKYLINNNENVLDLTKANNNIFEVQNIFKSGETVDVGLFEYDEKNPYSQQLVNNPTLQIYEGGFRYLPILHNVSGAASASQYFELASPISITVSSTGGGGGGIDPTSPYLQASNYTVIMYCTETKNVDIYGNSAYNTFIKATYNGGNLAGGFGVLITVSYKMPVLNSDPCGAASNSVDIFIANGSSSDEGQIMINVVDGASGGSGNGSSTNWTISGQNYTPPSWQPCLGLGHLAVSDVSAVGGGGGGGGTTSTSTYYTTQVTSSQPCLYYISQSNQLVFNSVLSQYYSYSPTFNSLSDPFWSGSSLERVVLPFSLAKGDKVVFYDYSSSLGWNEKFEYTINTIQITGSGTGSRLLAEIVPGLNLSLVSVTSSDAVTGAPLKACRYVVYKHVPDETNVMLRYNPKDSTIVEEGLLYPQYLYEEVKKNAGNIVKSLTSQNLIKTNTKTQ